METVDNGPQTKSFNREEVYDSNEGPTMGDMHLERIRNWREG